MQSPYSNPYLSLKARGLFAYYIELGRVVSADELSAAMPEGRDAIQGAINELRHSGYIMSYKEHVKGKWRTYMKFTEAAKKAFFTDNGFSGLLSVCTTNSAITTSDNTIVELLRSSTILGAELPKEEGDVEMPWNLDGEETVDGEFHSKSQMRRVNIMREAEDAPGAVGKIEDKKALRKAKYGAVAIAEEHRNDKAEESWNTGDLVSEFAMLLGSSSAGHLTMQLNVRSLSLWINQQIGKGATRQQMLAAIRMFFEDPRNLNNAGTGIPVWRRFISGYQRIEGKVLEPKPNYEVDKAHQEKMLRLLGGK